MPVEIPAEKRIRIESAVSTGFQGVFEAMLQSPVEDSQNFTWAPLIEGRSVADVVVGGVSQIFDSYKNKAFGIRPTLTVLLGGYPSIPDMTLSFRLWAEEDLQAEIYNPLMVLKKLVTPNFDSSTFQLYSTREVEVWIGNFIHLPIATIKSVSTTYSEMIIDGMPGFVDGTITVSPNRVLGADDLDSIYISVGTE